MENKKTISYLNSNAWYRLVKVFFSIGFLIVLAIFNIIAFSGGVRKLDLNNTSIKCNLYDKQTFSPASINVSFSNSDFDNEQFNYKRYFEGYNDYATLEILTACYPDKKIKSYGDSYDTQKGLEVVNKYGLIGVKDRSQAQIDMLNVDYQNWKQETSSLFGNQKTQYLDFSIKAFDVIPVFTYDSFLELFFIGNIIILIIIEATRRGFYYIVLGSIKPEK